MDLLKGKGLAGKENFSVKGRVVMVLSEQERDQTDREKGRGGQKELEEGVIKTGLWHRLRCLRQYLPLPGDLPGQNGDPPFLRPFAGPLL